MKKALGLIVGIVASLIGLAVLLVVVVVVLLQTGALNGLIEQAIAEQVGRPARLEEAPSLGFEDGALTLSLGPLSVANADWAKQQRAYFARIQELQASLRLRPLLSGRIELPEVVASSAKIHLARAEDGEVNWPQGDESQPRDDPTSLPRIEKLIIRNAEVTYADAQAGTDVRLTLDEATGRLGGDQDVALQATGRLQDAPLELSAAGGSLTELLERAAMSEPATIEATVGQSRISAQATAFTDLQTLDATVEVDADQALTDLLSSLGIATADLPPFQANMQIEPGDGGSLVTADLSTKGADVHLDGRVDDLSAPLDGFATRFTADAPQLGPILASFDVPYADRIPSAKLEGEVAHDGERTTVALRGDVGGDSIELEGGCEGAITAFLNPRVDLYLEGAALGALPEQLGFARRPIERYRIEAQVQRSGETSSVKLDVTVEQTRVRFDGSIDQLRALKGIDGKIDLEGPDPAAVLDLFKLPTISLPPYQIAGHVTWRGEDIKVTGLDGKVGDSDAQGDIAIDLRQEPPAVVADLHSDVLDFDDLAGLIGAPPATGEGETASAEQEQQAETMAAQERLLPQAEIDPQAWQNLNLDVRYSAGRIESENLPIDRIKTHVVSKDGWLTVDPLATGLADGSILGFVSLDGTQDPVAGEFDVRLEALQLQDMLAKLGVSGEGLGEIDGRIRFRGRGRSLATLLGTADGRIGLTMTGGAIDALILEAIGLDIAEGVVVLLDSAEQAEEDKVPIRCAIANLQLDQGVATARPIVIDTIDSKITVEGQINLKDETLDVFVQSYPKDPSLFSANQPIHVDGKLTSPSVNPAPGKVESEALGWLLAPVAALLPFFDVGGEEDSPCASLVAQAKEAAEESPEDRPQEQPQEPE